MLIKLIYDTPPDRMPQIQTEGITLTDDTITQLIIEFNDQFSYFVREGVGIYKVKTPLPEGLKTFQFKKTPNPQSRRDPLIEFTAETAETGAAKNLAHHEWEDVVQSGDTAQSDALEDEQLKLIHTLNPAGNFPSERTLADIGRIIYLLADEVEDRVRQGPYILAMRAMVRQDRQLTNVLKFTELLFHSKVSGNAPLTRLKGFFHR